MNEATPSVYSSSADEETLSAYSVRSGGADEYVTSSVLQNPVYSIVPPSGFVLSSGPCGCCGAAVAPRIALHGAPRPYGWSVEDADTMAPLCDGCLSRIGVAQCLVCRSMSAPALITVLGEPLCICCVCTRVSGEWRAAPCQWCGVCTDRFNYATGRCLVCATVRSQAATDLAAAVMVDVQDSTARLCLAEEPPPPAPRRSPRRAPPQRPR